MLIDIKLSKDELAEYLDILSDISQLKKNDELCGVERDRKYLILKELSDMGLFINPIEENKSVWHFLRPVTLSLHGERYFRELRLKLSWKYRFYNMFKKLWEGSSFIIKFVLITFPLLIAGIVAFMSNFKNVFLS